MSLTLGTNQNIPQILVFLDYQKSEPEKKLPCFLIELSRMSFQFSNQMLMEQMKPINTAKKDEIESGDESSLKAHFGIFRSLNQGPK